MRDLQHRLSALGFDASADEAGVFGPATAAAIVAFQERRGLPAAPVCDQATWDALVEAGWRLGDRPLYLTAPMLRGDDVADLQRRLGALGFDAGRVDGIFGSRTERALIDFQRNYGLVADAVLGPATVAALARLGDRNDGPASIVDVRERERFRCGPRSLAERTVAIGHAGGLDAFASGVARALRQAGAEAVVVQHPEPSEQAAAANTLDVDVFLAVALAAGSDCRIAYYRSPAGWESKGGRLLADLLWRGVRPLLPCDARGPSPMSVPILRETRMPAVLVELGPPAAVVELTGALATALQAALEEWIRQLAADR